MTSPAFQFSNFMELKFPAYKYCVLYDIVFAKIFFSIHTSIFLKILLPANRKIKLTAYRPQSLNWKSMSPGFCVYTTYQLLHKFNWPFWDNLAAGETIGNH